MRGAVWRLGASVVATVAGLLIVPLVVAYPVWSVVPWVIVGVLPGIVAGRASRVWVAWLGALIGVPLMVVLGLVVLQGDLAIVGIAFSVGLVAILASLGFIAGSALVTRRRTLSLLRADWRNLPGRVRWLSAIGVATVMLVVAGFSIYVGVRGAHAWVEGGVSPDCRTPAYFGWPYQAINYDQANDVTLAWGQFQNEAGELYWSCPDQGTAAGTDVVTTDGVPIAGWYIPAASDPDPAGPTVVIVPGAKSNKSSMLEYAQPLHDRFNLVMLDNRGMGRSRPGTFSLGLNEHLDVEAMVNWVEGTKHPRWLAALGDSLGAESALAAAVDDPRVGAVVLDSMHAQAMFAAGNIMETEYGLPPLPGSLAIVGFASLELGGNVTSLDPLATISRLHERPVLLIHGTADKIDVPALSVDLVVKAANAAGLQVELHWCPSGQHGQLVSTCASDWTRWVNDFLERAASTAPAGG
jgi:pimeloyl-ACP methyl ester carboxylesterase